MIGPPFLITKAEHLLQSAATTTTGCPREAEWIAWANVVPHMCKLPARRATFWSAGLVKENTLTFPFPGMNSS